MPNSSLHDPLAQTVPLRRRPQAADLLHLLIAGAVALVVNFALLALWDMLGIVTAHGGFQRLAKLRLAAPMHEIGLARLWATLALPAPDTTVFMAGFKIGVGFVMALLYGWTEPLFRASWSSKALLWALLVWLINAGLVLPLLGEGFAGIRNLTPTGILAFAVAHTAFYLVLVAWRLGARPFCDPQGRDKRRLDKRRQRISNSFVCE